MSERLLFLIRHGRFDVASTEMLTTARGRQWDPPLDEHGREQARMLARRLSLIPSLAAVYCSPFQRCRETLDPFVEATGVEVTYVDDLGEAFIGDWEGRSFEKIIEEDPEMLQLLRTQEGVWRRAPRMEKLADLRARIIPTIEEILAKHTEGSVVILAHGGVINAYMAPILGLHDSEMFFLPEHTSINTVEIDGEQRRVRFLSDVQHLTQPHFFEPGS